MIYILCFGNPFIELDSLALQLADYFAAHPIKGVEFVKCIAPDEIFKYTDKEFYILDVVQGIKEVTLIDDIDALSNEPKASAHDFDLGFFLRMMKELGKIEKVKIIGVPIGSQMKDVKEKVKETINSFLD